MGGETTRGKRPGGNDQGAKQLGEEMAWGRNDPDSQQLSVATVYGQLVLLQTRTESTRTFSLVNSYFFATRTLVNSYFFFGQLVLFFGQLVPFLWSTRTF